MQLRQILVSDHFRREIPAFQFRLESSGFLPREPRNENAKQFAMQPGAVSAGDRSNHHGGVFKRFPVDGLV
jgi:hypothetical protein